MYEYEIAYTYQRTRNARRRSDNFDKGLVPRAAYCDEHHMSI